MFSTLQAQALGQLALAEKLEEFTALKEKLVAMRCRETKRDGILVRVAEIVRSQKLLALLAHDRSFAVRAAVAENHMTPMEVMLVLANDPHPDVRYSVADNHTSPLAALNLLLDDPNPYVADRAKRTLARVVQRTAEVIRMPSREPRSRKRQSHFRSAQL
ncbi:MAG TPA: hypothetical protein V6D17_06860 [Candidatus Obscuribacterales bacterium]